MCGCKIKNKLSINIKIYFTITMVTNNNTNFLTLIKEKTAFFQKRNLDGFYFKNWNVQLILSSLSLFNPFPCVIIGMVLTIIQNGSSQFR